MELSPNDLVQAKNESDLEVDVVGTIFPPHAMKVVTFPWMMNHFGDPRSVRDSYQVIRLPNGTTMGVAPRQVEVERVNRMWNCGAGDGMRAWADIPKITFYNMDGERIFTAYDDPGGTRSTVASTTIDEQAAQQSKIQTLERQVAQLLEISGLDKDALPSDDIPTDDSLVTGTTSPWASSESIILDDEDVRSQSA